jgi:hypothetical protein
MKILDFHVVVKVDGNVGYGMYVPQQTIIQVTTSNNETISLVGTIVGIDINDE